MFIIQVVMHACWVVVVVVPNDETTEQNSRMKPGIYGSLLYLYYRLIPDLVWKSEGLGQAIRELVLFVSNRHDPLALSHSPYTYHNLKSGQTTLYESSFSAVPFRLYYSITSFTMAGPGPGLARPGTSQESQANISDRVYIYKCPM